MGSQSFEVKVPFDIGAPLLWEALSNNATLPRGIGLEDCEFRVTSWPQGVGEVDRDVQLYLTLPRITDPGPGHYVLGYPLELNNRTHAVSMLGSREWVALRELVMPLAEELRKGGAEKETA